MQTGHLHIPVVNSGYQSLLKNPQFESKVTVCAKPRCNHGAFLKERMLDHGLMNLLLVHGIGVRHLILSLEEVYLSPACLFHYDRSDSFQIMSDLQLEIG